MFKPASGHGIAPAVGCARPIGSAVGAPAMWPALVGAVAIWAALVGALAICAGSALASGTAQESTVGLMRVGRLPTLPAGATVAGRLRPGTHLHVTVALTPRDPAALAAYVRAVSTPGSDRYRAYLSPRQFAQRFGATAGQLNLVRRSLRAHGLNPGAPSPNSLSIPVRATAARLQRAFSLSLLRLVGPGRGTAITATAAPSFDRAAAGVVQAVIGLDTVGAPAPLAVRRAHPAGLSPLALAPARGRAQSLTRGRARGRAQRLTPGRARGRVITGGPTPCAQAQASAPSQSAYTADQIASAYGLGPLYQAGDEAAGVTIAVYELEPDDPDDIAGYQACYGTHTSVTYIPIDGGAGRGAGSGEAALDIENLIGLAPESNLLVYQGPNSNSASPGSGPYDLYSQIINQDRAQVVSVSWGQCESDQGDGALNAENTLFEQAAVQGQTIVAASGDNGSEDCNTGGTGVDTQLAVDDPAGQPLVTGVGGTTLNAIGPRPLETVWNSAGASTDPGQPPGAGGGGNSSFWPMPADQRSAAGSLHVIGSGSSGAPCGNTGGYCREVPDVAADADPSTGYLIYWNGAGAVAGQPTQWQGIGGTSGAAPVWAALIALSDASAACAGTSIGFADPALYRAAGAAYASDFNDIVGADNDLTATNGGLYPAGAGYDLATGLGTPNAAPLAAGLCHDALRIATPGPQRSTLQARIGLRLTARDVPGAKVAYRAAGLPAGLSINRTTGRISGRPRRRGAYTVTVIGLDTAGASSTIVFPWTVGGPPRVSGAVISGLASARPRLTLTVAAGVGAPEIRTVSLRLPHGLRFASARRVSLAAPGVNRTRFSDRLGNGSLVIALRAPAARLQVTVAYPALRGGAGLLPSARLPRGGAAPRLSLSLLDATGASSRLSIALRRDR
jgi:hypothetical protein